MTDIGLPSINTEFFLLAKIALALYAKEREQSGWGVGGGF